jgi:N-methylhydantoinase A
MLQDEPINVMTLRAIARAPALTRDIYGTATPAQAGRGGLRRAYFGPNYGYLEARRVSRIDLAADRLDGPILIEEYDTTIVVPPRWSARATDHHDLLIEAS